MRRAALRQLHLPGGLLEALPAFRRRHRLPHHASLQRVVDLMMVLRQARTGYTYRFLAERYGVKVRTIRRDVDTLKAVGCGVAVSQDSADEPARVGRLTFPWEECPGPK